MIPRAESAAIDETGELKPGGRIKLFGLKHWVITQSDPETGELIHHHGETYKREGDTKKRSNLLRVASSLELERLFSCFYLSGHNNNVGKLHTTLQVSHE